MNYLHEIINNCSGPQQSISGRGFASKKLYSSERFGLHTLIPAGTEMTFPLKAYDRPGYHRGNDYRGIISAYRCEANNRIHLIVSGLMFTGCQLPCIASV